ncbi:hypothetical protein M885DRAFT_577431 [Pelagophyceae sp. CCMP2097]|nr:hypothetical protein M885DRAFT_577431 [Pelagophyceae sp. CCMP2097]
MGAMDLKKVCRDMRLHQGGNKEALRMRVENFIDHNHNKIYIQVVPSDRPYTPGETITPGFVDEIFEQMLETDINIPTPLLLIDYETRPASHRDDFILKFIRDNCVPLEYDAGVAEGEVGRMHVNLAKFKRMLMREFGLKRPSIEGTAAANRALDASMRVGGTSHVDPPAIDKGFDAHLCARLLMVLIDPDLAGDLARINEGDNSRAEIEAGDPWDLGVAIAFNDDTFKPPNFRPDNIDVSSLDPSRAPEKEYSGAFLKAKLSALKSLYAKSKTTQR